MDTILNVLLWGGLFFLMMRFGCGSHMFGQGHGAENKKGALDQGHGGCCGSGNRKRNRATAGAEHLTWEAPEKDVDPVCGKTISTTEARPSLHEGQVYYFCSRECREAFEALPEHYVGLGNSHGVNCLDHTQAKGKIHDRERSNY